MLKKRAQGLSITTIIIAVIGLIILVVLVAILTGRLGIFSTGLESAVTCKNSCGAIGMKNSYGGWNEEECNIERANTRILPGTYKGINSPNVCCCFP